MLPSFQVCVRGANCETKKARRLQPYPPPDVVDVMVRVLSEEGARILENYESGSFPNTEEVDWWSIAEEHSKVYFRRIKIYGSGL